MEKVGPNNPFTVTYDIVKPATEEQVQAFEANLGVRLPEDYRHFLLTINGGRRTPGGWEAPEHDIFVATFYGLRDAWYDLRDSFETYREALKDPQSGLPPDAFPFASTIGNEQYLFQYGGEHPGSIWSYEWGPPRDKPWKPGDPPIDADDEWRILAPSFSAFIDMLWQEPESPEQAELRRMLMEDDVEAMKVYVQTLSKKQLNEQDPDTGDTLLQRAADIGALQIVRLLLDHGATGLAGMVRVISHGHSEVARELVLHGYGPNADNWQSASVYARPELLRTFIEIGGVPSEEVLRDCLARAWSLLVSRPRPGRKEVVDILDRLVKKAAKKRGK